MQRPRNPYSSADIDRASHEREDDERMIELAASGAARFVPIDSEKNLVKTGGNPEAVFLQGGGRQSGYAFGAGITWLINRSARLSATYDGSGIQGAASGINPITGDYGRNIALLTLRLGL